MSNLYYESSFMHHGVRGQKWGVRRYQTSDGRWTNLGRKRNKVKDLKRSERDKTDRTKARLEAQKKKLLYEESLTSEKKASKDSLKSKVKKSVDSTVQKAKFEKSRYDSAVKKTKMFKEDEEIVSFLNSISKTTINAISKNPKIYEKDDITLKGSLNTRVDDIKDLFDDIADRIDF